jgi:hypothetical protein
MCCPHAGGTRSEYAAGVSKPNKPAAGIAIRVLKATSFVRKRSQALSLQGSDEIRRNQTKSDESSGVAEQNETNQLQPSRGLQAIEKRGRRV